MGIGDDLERAIERFGETVHAVDERQWTMPTPCTEWDVRALLNHLVNEALWVRPLMEGMTIAEVGDRLDGDLLGDDPKAAFDEAAAEATAAATGPGAVDRIVHISAGDTPAGEYLSQVFTDFVIHRWDLARAIGVDDTINPADAAAIYEQMRPREHEMRSWGVYGGTVTAPPGADLQTKLLALFGRAQ